MKSCWLTATQPIILPAVHIVARWAQCDLLLWMQDAQYSRSLAVAKTTLIDPDCKEVKVTLPLSGSKRGPVGEMRLADADVHLTKFSKRLQTLYGKYEAYRTETRHEFERLIDQLRCAAAFSVDAVAEDSFQWLRRLLDLRVESLFSGDRYSSEESEPTAYLADMARGLGATDYMQGCATIDAYFKRGEFAKRGVRVFAQHYSVPGYTAGRHRSVTNLSILDWLATKGVAEVKAEMKQARASRLLWNEVWEQP